MNRFFAVRRLLLRHLVRTVGAVGSLAALATVTSAGSAQAQSPPSRRLKTPKRTPAELERLSRKAKPREMLRKGPPTLPPHARPSRPDATRQPAPKTTDHAGSGRRPPFDGDH